MGIDPRIAYFSMEVAIAPKIPTYSGGLGVLAGDTVRAAADMNLPMVAMTLIHHQGYFHQKLDADGKQQEEAVQWNIREYMEECSTRSRVTIEGRDVHLGVWKYDVVGTTGHTIPVFFLDSKLPENSEWDQSITDNLYGGDSRYRLCQEVLLGVGGIRMLRGLGYCNIDRFHMNEGHSALLTLELLNEKLKSKDKHSITQEDCNEVRQQCIFTTHTPVPAGHDHFSMELVSKVLGHRTDFFDMTDAFCINLVNRILENENGVDFKSLNNVFSAGVALNLTYLALNLSHFINGVAKKHGEVSRHMFGNFAIDSITNGVHAATWTSKHFQKLYDAYIPGWREDNFSLRYALSIPGNEIWDAENNAKKELFDYVASKTKVAMDLDVFTLGFARRTTRYKRPDLFFEDIGRLKAISANAGAIQIIFAGKAHPKDKEGKDLIKQIVDHMESLKEDMKIVYLEDYGMKLGMLLTAGVDVWLNTPEPPLEASGTSGMKAALNGVPSLSVLDGWWCEGCIEGITGWSIAGCKQGLDESNDRSKDATTLYDKLEQAILPLYYQNRSGFIDVMRHTIALNGSFFNTQRMLQQYISKAYF